MIFHFPLSTMPSLYAPPFSLSSDTAPPTSCPAYNRIGDTSAGSRALCISPSRGEKSREERESGKKLVVG
jgi:hypothetical protein